jgi:hypothetical protein
LYWPQNVVYVSVSEGNDPVLSIVNGPSGRFSFEHGGPVTSESMLTLAPDCVTMAVVGQENEKDASGAAYVVVPE